MIRLAPPAAECRLLTFREGFLSGFGHDLELEVTQFELRIDDAARMVEATFDPASLRVVRALRDGLEVRSGFTASDRRTIEENVRNDVLEAARHPEITFRSTRVAGVADGFDVIGRLALHGREREITIPLRRAGNRYTADVRLRQPDFAIRPYSALLGAIKVKPEVIVRLSLPFERD